MFTKHFFFFFNVVLMMSLPGLPGSTIQRQRLSKLNSEFDVSGLVINPEFHVRFYEEALEVLKREVPSDGREVVDWMHDAAATNIDSENFMQEYNEACELSGVEVGSNVFARGGDGYIPGVGVDHWHYNRWRGTYVRRVGYARVHGDWWGQRYGIRSFNVHRGTWAYRIGRIKVDPNYLRVVEGVVGWCGSIQFDAWLAVFRRLAALPIRRAVRFPRPWGISAPIHFLCRWQDITPARVVRIYVSVDRPSRLKVIFRDLRDLRNVGEDTVDLDRGTYEIDYMVTHFEIGNPLILSLEPHTLHARYVVRGIDYFP